MSKYWLRQFHFTKNERQGVQALLLLSVIIFVLPSSIDYFTKKKEVDYSSLEAQLAMLVNTEATVLQENSVEEFYFDPNTASFDDFITLGLSERISNRILNYRDKGGRFFEAEDFSKIYGLPNSDFDRLENFIQIERNTKYEYADQKSKSKNKNTDSYREVILKEFDPNTASFDDFLSLGLSKRTAHSIENYREKGGQFKYKSDFQKIYTLDKGDFQRLYDYINLPKKEDRIAFAGPTTYKNSIEKQVKSKIIDINSASKEEWQTLKGIGPSFANRIVNYREKLGGFASLEQVGETYGLPDSVFQNIQIWLQPSSVFRPLHINSVNEKELLKHPYISKKQAKLIVAYRGQHGKFQSKEELLNIKILKESWLSRIEAYLSL